MSKRATDAAWQLYPDYPSMDGGYVTQRKQRELVMKGYEYAEKDTIERVISWVRKNAYIYTDTQNDEEGNLMTVFLEEAFTNDLIKAMEEVE